MPDFIKLPSERVEQLRLLSEKLDMSIADCIAMFIREQVAKGNLPDDVPGISIKRVGENVTLDVGAFSTVLAKEAATAYAAKVRGMLSAISEPTASNPFMPSLKLTVARRGTSLKLIDDTGAAKTLAPSVAEDFARVLTRSAE